MSLGHLSRNPREGTQRLWSMVIIQALRDALKDHPERRVHNTETLRAREARDWITKPNPDFLYVCQLADVPPETVRKAYLGLTASSARKALAWSSVDGWFN